MVFQKLCVSSDGRHLINEDGSAFFYLADTAWELFHRLNREDAVMYLDDRANKGFTVVQAVALAEFDGIDAPNAYGRHPLKKNAEGAYDPTIPDLEGDYSYWDHVDFVIREAEKRSLYVALLPTWGDKFNRMWGKGPEIFNPQNAFSYGEWIARRYAHAPNIIWILGGDRPLLNRRHFETVCQMAEGIQHGDQGIHLISFHPPGGNSSSTPLHEEEWLAFNMIQSGHTRSRYNYEMIAKDYALQPPKPVIDAEPGYEDHPESFNPQNGYMDAADIRQFAYMALLSGACGHTYGNHSIWSMVERLPVEGFQPGHFCVTWRQALNSPGAAQMRHAKDLLMAHDFLSGKPCPDYVENQLDGVLHVPALTGVDYLLAYISQGQSITLKAGVLEGKKVRVRWYDPREGHYQEAGQADLQKSLTVIPPSGGRGNDWVLVLEVI